MNATLPPKRKGFGQKAAWIIAMMSYVAAVGCALGAVFYGGERFSDPIMASLMASVVFFAGCGVVLHVIANTHLNGLLSVSDPPERG